jgi:hypothetical protein
MFLEIHGRRFSGRTYDDNTVRTLLNMKINQRSSSIGVTMATRLPLNMTILSSEKRIFYLKPVKRKSLPSYYHPVISKNIMMTWLRPQPCHQFNLF